ncbi:hypothetical protein THRCLA_09473, partial [Thraustotheca clavata]
YLDLTAKKDENENGNKEAGSTAQSITLQTPNQDDSRTPADNLSEEEDDDSNSKPATATSTPVKLAIKLTAEHENMNDDDDDDEEEEDKYDIQKDPNYIQLIQLQRHQQKQLSDLEKEINTALASVAATTNFVLKGRFQEKVDTLQQSKVQLFDSINETNQSIADMEAAANA